MVHTRSLLLLAGLGALAFWWKQRVALATSPNLASPAHIHAAKLPAWTMRLQSATYLLEQALQRGNYAAVVNTMDDVLFWIGRLVGEGFGAEGAASRRNLKDGADILVRAYTVAQDAKAFLLCR
tara:strand:- start:277 stop:648 length:372 start_codon:yes stop_codon:yes gene_type:complete